ncbi:hypothetical protein [uncultured Albimonas sp.]|uniref:hypothetical protein n=1 Tax=uncultured Albimonas sp. TaxID=1331701 RepID=UPI0030EBB297
MNMVTRLAPRRTDAALDLEALKALEDALGPDECAELVDDGLLEATDRLVAIERALEEESWSRLGRLARELALIAPRIGLTSLALQAEALEDCCQCLDRTAAHAVGQRLLRCGEAALSASLLRPAG